MKFLTLTSLKDSASMLPPAVSRQLLEATIDYMNKMKQAGKVLEMYHLAGCERYVVISELDSAEELAMDAAALPFGPFMNWETYALADSNEVWKVELEIMKRAEKLFPAPK